VAGSPLRYRRPVALVAVRAWASNRSAVYGARGAERELLGVLREHGELTPTAAAMLTPLTATEATKNLGRLAREGHLDTRFRDGSVGRVRAGHRRLTLSEPPAEIADRDEPVKPTPARPLGDPLSGRELAVLELLAEGCTNREIAQRLFIAQGRSRPTWRASTASSRSTPVQKLSPGRKNWTSSASPDAHRACFDQNTPRNPPLWGIRPMPLTPG
jgi:hypothetical protein